MADERSRLLHAEESSQSSDSSDSTVEAEKRTPLPWRAIIILLLLNACQPLAFEVIFPFVNQMILENGIVNDPEQVGFYSGVIESVFSCMSFICILPVSRMSDYFGRKPIILCGVLGIALSTVLFGMSKSFLTMVLSRCFGGGMGGSWASMRIMLGEMTDRSNQGLAFSGLTIAYRTGQIIGLPLGGTLAHPERHFSLFQGKFWYRYPYALPCFLTAAFAVIGVILAYFLLEETLPSKRQSKLNNGSTLSPDDTAPDSAALESNISQETAAAERFRPASLRSVLTPTIISILISNVAMCLVSEALFAVYPLFAFTPVHSGGLGVNEAAIGTQMAIRAVLHIVVMSFFAPFERRVGAMRVYQITMSLWPVVVACYPVLNWLARRGGAPWELNVGLFVFFMIWSFCGFTWTAISVVVNDAAPSAGALAAINGVSQMTIVLPQAIAPGFVTAFFAASIKSGIAGGNLVWIVMFVLTCVAAFHSFTLRESTDDWRKSKTAAQQ